MTRVVAVVQARLGSSRLPGKVLRPLAGKPVLWHVLHRLGKCRRVDAIVVATTEQAVDDALVDYSRAEGVVVVRGPEDDVLGRYVMAAEQSHADVVVRVTGDAPLIDPAIIDLLINTLVGEGAEFCTGRPDVPTIHEGFSPLTTSLLRRLQHEVGNDPAAREHVTGYLSLHPEFARTAYAEIPSAHNFAGARVSVDTPQDLQFLEALYARIGAPPGDLDVADVVSLLQEQPQLLRINASVHQKAADERSLRVLIRCDGDHELGLGHISRCTAIAEALRSRHGCGVLFAMQRGAEGAALLEQADFPVTLASDGSEQHWLDELAARWHPDGMLLDVRTDLQAEPLRRWREQGIVLAVLDDGSERRLAADLVFYPPVPQVAKLDWPGFTGRLHVGWEWVPLRPGFQYDGKRSAGNPLRVLIAMGGSDPDNLAAVAARALDTVRNDFKITFVLGSGYTGEPELQATLANVRYAYRVLRRVEDMPALMLQSDLAVASFGVTAYELAALGVPSIYLCHTPDHALSASALAAAGAAISVGINTPRMERALGQAIDEMLSDSAARSRLSHAGPALVDGRGAWRIAEAVVMTMRARHAPTE